VIANFPIQAPQGLAQYLAMDKARKRVPEVVDGEESKAYHPGLSPQIAKCRDPTCGVPNVPHGVDHEHLQWCVKRKADLLETTALLKLLQN
jgi:hypothetical protein